MSNFFRDNPDILFQMEHLDFSRIVELKEEGFADRDRFPEAPTDLEDAVDNYRRVLDIVGDIAGGYVAPRAEQVDRTGARFADGVVTYAPGTREALERLRQAEVMGFTLPRRYGGLNMPKTVYSIAIEMISRADASLMNIFGLQEIADTINKFGSEEQKQRYLPRFCEGSVMGSMALTEPDAGSDLQSVRLRSHKGEDGIWRLNGVKRFITNGCADISLVMARSEEGTTGGRGISLYIYERDEHMRIRRIEEKLGIHGSPTCELQFDDAPAELLGRRKMGLVKYTMSLMNGARLGVAAQAVGIAEAACREATRYARDRIQFKKPIHQFAAVYEMLTCMQVDIEAARTLLYETSRIVDIKEGLEEKAERHPESARDIAGAIKRYTKLAGVLTPMVKAYASEVANRICYDAIQVHAGVGFTCDFPVERLYRDVRITNIYEGTTQLQVVAAIGTVLGGGISELLSAYEEEYDFSPVSERFAQAEQLRRDLEAAVSAVKQAGDPAFQEYHSRRIVETAIDAVTGYRLCIDALYSERKRKVAALFLGRAVHRCKTRLEIILSGDRNCMDFHPEIIAGFPE